MNLLVAMCLLGQAPAQHWEHTTRAAAQLGFEISMTKSQLPGYATAFTPGRGHFMSHFEPGAFGHRLRVRIVPMAPPYYLMNRPDYPINGSRNVAFVAANTQVGWEPAPPHLGIPIGDVDAIMDDQHSFSVYAFADKTFFIVMCMEASRRNKRGYSEIVRDVPEEMRGQTETFTRWMISDFRGNLPADSSTVKVNGASLPTLRVQDSVAAQTAFGQWASASGWGIRTNEDAGTVYLTKGSRTILAPVGTNAMKVDGKWIRTRGVTFYKNGTYYADVANLP